jgi:glycosyltransferase involved in cell wall biosynthesis
MSLSPRVSIITVNLNDFAGLEKTIQSVISQTFRDYEFLIIDGGSDDGSLDVIKKYQAHITHWVSEPDSGVYEAMNKGIKKAVGQYCLFLNSGDYLTSPYVLAGVFDDPAEEDILIGACRVLENGKEIHIARPSAKLTMADFYGRTIPHQSSFIKRSLFHRYGYYSQAYKIHGDYEFWIRTIILNNCSVRVLDIVVADYSLEGMSSREENMKISAKECRTILQNTIPARILADYEAWSEERRNMRPLYWAARKPVLFLSIKTLYRLAGTLVQITRKKNKNDFSNPDSTDHL